MSGVLRITFDNDMPPATVEVVAPDLESVARMWMGPGQQESVDVPSEGSFLRVHLASGEIVTLDNPGNLNRHVSRGLLDEQLSPRRLRRAEMRHEGATAVVRGLAHAEPPGKSLAGPSLAGFHARLWDGLSEIPAQLGGNGSFVWRPENRTRPHDLRIDAPMRVRLRLPGFLEELEVRDEEAAGGRRVVRVRVRTTSAAADSIGGYLRRGDLHGAASMAQWASEAKELLAQKMRNPFSAAVGAYLLLRLRDFARLHDWPKNLADWFPEISDGRVLWAWQMIHQHGSEAEIRKYLREALDAGLPIYTEGLRLLHEGFAMVGDETALRQLNERAGIVLWNSPFTATCDPAGAGRSLKVELDVDYARRI